MPISALLARIRKLVPSPQDDRYQQIKDGFGDGTFRPPITPMTDQELSMAISEFLKASPGAETNAALAKRFNP
ncbi:MAG TPA: hypothetical protein VHB49_15975 [Bradyrhizobium sp.]|nr:hypothetical protein [Bradyrhizobium sp.]